MAITQSEPPEIGAIASFPIVAIGASAGGVEAVSEFVKALTPDSRLAFMLILHRDPDYDSLLTEILSRATGVPVVAIQSGMVVEAGRIYVVPANRALTMDGGTMLLHDRDTPERRRMPIDLMFSSLAQAHGRSSIGVVLSGTGSDGAIGIREIKAAGGITFAQDPASAKFNGMPDRAIDTGCVDFVLPAKAIAEEIERIAQHPYLRDYGAELPSDSSDREGSLRKIFRLLRTQTHVDFSHYKRSTIERRLGRRMAMRQTPELAEYAALLHDDPGEVDAVVEDFLIPVTSFFRDPEVYKGLAEIVFPKLLEDRSPQDSIRIWVPGCATGEEVYSVAIALIEFLADRSITTPVQIFGTDLSEKAIQKARAGIFLNNVDHAISDERMHRFFNKLEDHYQAARSIRDICIFARHNVVYDPPFSRMDLICCRNLLIYFDQVLQRQAIQSFHYALKPRGFLMLGQSENLQQQSSELFRSMDKRYRIYRKGYEMPHTAIEAVPAGRAIAPPAEVKHAVETLRGEPMRGETTRADTVRGETVPGEREVERLLLARYAPACVLIDEALNILYFQGKTGRYLEHARGSASLSLQKLARPWLLADISSAIQQARREGAPAHRQNIHVEASGDRLEVNIEVIPLRLPDADANLLIVLFHEALTRADALHLGRMLTGWWGELISATARSSRNEKDRRIRQLEHEVESTRDYLQAAIEEHEAAQEELKSAHEEALSANEEFQSTNEELETAKEELQSANEELSTTNEELRNRNRELAELNDRLAASRDHMNAIFDTLREPFLVLDADHRVIQANGSFYAEFQTTREQTEHHVLYELGNGQWDIPALRHMLEEILPNNAVHDYEVSHVFPLLGNRTMHLNARRIEAGDHWYAEERILLAIEDITERQDAVNALIEADHRKDQFLAMLSHELRNPLAPIENALQLIRLEGSENPIQQRARATIERQVGQLTRLLTDLLEVSRVTSGAVALQPDDVELAEILTRAVETSRPLIEQRQHQLVISIPDRPIALHMDSTRLEQVFANLLTNAAKYTDPGGQIRLTAERDGGQVVVRVSDNGIGIERALLPHIFEIFTQAQRGLARSQGGLGIGLSVVKALVELHNGTIEAHSEGLGRGSDFIVRLPTIDAAAAISMRLEQPKGRG
ncbi:MAG: hypothetical protein IVW54_08720 [Candidatus Binataceae bacterium]|nr:hypothetical protein [Candidatus Binataceae bacterium]